MKRLSKQRYIGYVIKNEQKNALYKLNKNPIITYWSFRIHKVTDCAVDILRIILIT